MDQIDRQLLDWIQRDFPLVSRPFFNLGEKLGIDEGQVLERVRRLTQDGIIRQIGPIYSASHLGYHSTLAAFSVKSARIDSVAERVSSHPGVSHNYARDHLYNLWFTLTIPGNQDLEQNITRMAHQCDIENFLHLPALRTFRLGVHFDLSGNSHNKKLPNPNQNPQTKVATDFEKAVIRATQGDLPLLAHPFAPAAKSLELSEEQLLDILRDFNQKSIIRRFAAVLRHRKAGFRANGMGCWAIPEDQINKAGETAASFDTVSHCYHRPAFPPQWPYNLFTMVHGHHRAEVEEQIEVIREALAEEALIPQAQTILYSVKEFKKTRVRYFEENAE